MIDPLTRQIHRGAGKHGPLMLMYHAVLPGDGVPMWPWAVSMSSFCAQLDLLHEEGWNTPTIQELVDRPYDSGQRSVAITFDDGYADNFAVSEELRKRDMRATWFIVTGSIGSSPRWQADGRPNERLLDAAELREMHATGMEIGSHTVSHIRLPDSTSADRNRELLDSKARLEEILGGSVMSFAYPYGAWNADCEDAVRAAGYRAACTTRTGMALRDGNPFRLRRLTVLNTDTVGSVARKMFFMSNEGDWSSALRYAKTRIISRIKG